jgi:hypothetical protein
MARLLDDSAMQVNNISQTQIQGDNMGEQGVHPLLDPTSDPRGRLLCLCVKALLSQPGVRELVEAEVTRHQAHNTCVLRDMLQAANLENGQLQTQIEAIEQQMAEIQRHLADQWGARRFFEALVRT